jgi:hypothetical protein
MDMQDIIDSANKLFYPAPIYCIVDDRKYAIRHTEEGPELSALIVPPAKPTLALCSLSGFRDAYEAGIDDFLVSGKTAVQVINHETVALISLEADEFGRRHEFLRSTNRESSLFPFNSYQAPEQFLLSLQMSFLPTEEVIQLQRFASSLTNESSIGTQDDGYTQVVTAKQGAVSRSEIPLPKRISLLPYRTFREIDPVQSEFIVRLKGEPGKLPTIALVEVDAGRWKHDTALLVKRWCVANLPDGVVVIA